MKGLCSNYRLNQIRELLWGAGMVLTNEVCVLAPNSQPDPHADEDELEPARREFH